MNLQNVYKNTSIVLTSVVLLLFVFIYNAIANAPEPASAHRDILLNPTPLEKLQTAPVVSSEQPNAPKTHIDEVPMSQKNPKPVRERSVDPYLLEKNYTLRKDPATIPQNQHIPITQPRTRTIKKIQKTPATTPSMAKLPSVTGKSSPKGAPEIEDPDGWQSSGFEFTKDRNIIYYPKDSKLKMISLQFYTEISTGGGTAKKVRQVLTKINTSLPISPLVIGLQQLYTNKALYPLSEWNKERFELAIKKVSSYTPRSTIGEDLRILRKQITNIPTPTRLILITDGESYDVDTVAFDLKLFYAPDPRFPLHIISFASTKDAVDSVEQILKVHNGSQLFNGDELLQNEAEFKAFMDQLFIK